MPIDIKTNKVITYEQLCQCCQKHEIAPWSETYCPRCDDVCEDRSDFEEEMGPREDYWTKRRKGLV